MAMTLRQFMDGPLRWALYEVGRQHLWNQLNQIINSEAGSGVVASTTILGSLDITAASGLEPDGTASPRTLSGPFSPTATGATAFKVPPSDPGGSVGPIPARQTNRKPFAGFRDSV